MGEKKTMGAKTALLKKTAWMKKPKGEKLSATAKV